MMAAGCRSLVRLRPPTLKSPLAAPAGLLVALDYCGSGPALSTSWRTHFQGSCAAQLPSQPELLLSPSVAISTQMSIFS